MLKIKKSSFHPSSFSAYTINVLMFLKGVACLHTEMIIIGSITYALKARNALQNAGLKARIRKLEPTGKKGCSYGIELPEGQLLTVASILRPLNLDYEIYSQ